MRRFLVHEKFIEGQTLNLSTEESRHAVKSLRLQPGAQIFLTDGQGQSAEAEIVAIEGEIVQARVIRLQVFSRGRSLALLQAPLKGPKMDWLVEKITELGVSDLHLIKTQHTVATGEKIERWQRLAQAAVKQSGNAHLPVIHPIRPLAEVAAQLQGLKILLQPGCSEGLAAVVAARREEEGGITLAIGPEGGFSAQEEAELFRAGFVPAALSLQILRGETAALAALAIAAHSIDF